jgi:lysozyme family protein
VPLREDMLLEPDPAGRYSLQFRACVRRVIDDMEDDPSDPGRLTHDGGGPTRYGISGNGNPDLDIVNLTRERAVQRYHERYWAPIRADELPYEIALVLFDFYVQNQAAAVVELQKVLRVEADGVVGPDTIAAAHHIPKAKALRFISERIGWYELLASSHPRQAPNLRGWRWRMTKLACAIGECS